MSEITAARAAEVLGVSSVTVRDWAQRMGLGRRSSQGAWVYSDDDMHYLRSVQAMRNDGAGLDTITRSLRPSAEDQAQSGDPSPEGQPPTTQPAPDFQAMLQQMAEMVTGKIGEQTDLAQRYATAAHTIGVLEERVKSRDDTITDLRARLQAKDDEAKQLETRPEVVVPRSWWERLMGK